MPTRLLNWYCSHCGYGPLSTELCLHCPVCLRRRDKHARHEEAPRPGVPSIIATRPVESTTEPPNLGETHVDESESSLCNHDAQDASLATFPLKTTAVNQGTPAKRLDGRLLSQIRSSSKNSQLNTYLNEVSPWHPQKLLCNHDAQDASLATSPLKTTAVNQGTPSKRLDGRLLSQIRSSSKDSQLNTYLTNEVSPWHPQELIVQMARTSLPGVGVPFFARTGEHMRAPPRQRISPTRRAEIALTRKRGACKRCKKNKSLCTHISQDDEILPASPTATSRELLVEPLPQGARSRAFSIVNMANTTGMQQVAPSTSPRRQRRNARRPPRIRGTGSHTNFSSAANRMSLSSSAAQSIDRTSISEDDNHQLSYAETPITGSPTAITRNQQHTGQSSTYDEERFIASTYPNTSSSMISNHIEIPHHEFPDRFGIDSIAGVSQPRRSGRNMQLIEGIPLDHTGPIEATLDFENNRNHGYPSWMEFTEIDVEGNRLSPTRIGNPQTSNDISATINDFHSSPTLHHSAFNPPDDWQNNAAMLSGPGPGFAITHNGMHPTSAGNRSAFSETVERSVSSFSENNPLRPVHTFSSMVGFTSPNVDRALWNDGSSTWPFDTGLANHDPAVLSNRDTDFHPRSAIDGVNSNPDLSWRDEPYEDNEFFIDEDRARLHGSDFTPMGSTDSTNRSGITPSSEEDEMGS